MTQPSHRSSEPQRLSLLGALLLIQLAIVVISLILLPYRLVRASAVLLRSKPSPAPDVRDQKVFSEAPR